MLKEKPKAKEQETALQYWWNEFLFRKTFTFESHLPPDVCAESLRRINTPSGDWWTEMWRRRRLTSDVYSSIDYEYTFDIQARQRGKRRYYTTAQAKGSIHQDARGITIVDGVVKLGAGSQIGGLIAIGMFMMMFFWISGIVMREPVSLLIIIFVIGLTVMGWFQNLADRNHLIEQVRYAVMRGKSKR